MLAHGIHKPMTSISPGLYVFSSAAAASCVYVLLSSASKKTLSFYEFWKNGEGWCLFTDFNIKNPEFFAKNARDKLPKLTPQKGCLIWLKSQSVFDHVPIIKFQVSTSYNYGIADKVTFQSSRLSQKLNTNYGTFQLRLIEEKHNGFPYIQFLGDRRLGGFSIDNELQQVGLAFNRNDEKYDQWLIRLPLSGPATGSVGLSVALDPGTLYSMLGCYTLYGYDPNQFDGDKPPHTAAETSATRQLYLPLFPPKKKQQTDLNQFIAVEVLIHPFYPFEPAATGIRIDRFGRLYNGTAPTSGQAYDQVQNAKKLASPYAMAADGSLVTLIPADPLEEKLPNDAFIGGGFAFSQAPAAWLNGAAPNNASPGSVTAYLSPAGVFHTSIQANQGFDEQQKYGVVEEGLDLMPGLFASSFIRMAAGDRIRFEPGHLAWMKPHPSLNSTPSTLETIATTSYVAIEKSASGTGRGYFGQSGTANLYGSENASGISTTVNALLSPLEQTPAVPIIFYPAIHLQNPTVTASEITALEQKAIGPLRHHILLDAPNGPTIQLPPKSLSQSLTTPQAAPTENATRAVITPQGYLVELNESNHFSTITLALGTGENITPNALRFIGTGPQKLVSPEVSTLLTRDNLFLVATTIPQNWHFQNAISIAGFNFTIDLDGSDSSAILIIKLDKRRSLYDMALDDTSWTEGGKYVADNVKNTIDRLKKLFQEAEYWVPPKGGENPFAGFNLLAKSPSWTGVIAFDASINGNGMPQDFQILLGGISGQLRAHHVGVQTNKLSHNAQAGGKAEVKHSSIFGVINYTEQEDNPQDPKKPSTDPQYKISKLLISFANSVIDQLHVAVDLDMFYLLGRAVKLAPDNGNTLSIKGHYQRHGEIGRVTFATDTPFVFKMVADEPGVIRVVDNVTILHASLVPVSGTQGNSMDGDKQVVAHFVLDGQLFFHQTPFPNSDNLDLFSYGKHASLHSSTPQGLAFSGLTVEIKFTLNSQGAVKPGTKSVKLLESSLKPKATPEAVRKNSLLSSLPLKLSKFLTASDAKSAIDGNAKTINVLQLSQANNGDKGHDNDTTVMPVSPFVTQSPIYGLSFSISLGTLGSLSSVHTGITASMILGWGPSPTVPDNDAAAVLVQLPSLSAGYQGFDLQGILKTKFGDANLLKVDLDEGRIVYALLFDNIQLSVFGFNFPPGVLVDFLLFAGNAAHKSSENSELSNLAWLLSATTES